MNKIKLDHYSWSTLKLYITCPLKFKYRKVEGLHVAYNDFAKYGILIDNFICQCLEDENKLNTLKRHLSTSDTERVIKSHSDITEKYNNCVIVTQSKSLIHNDCFDFIIIPDILAVSGKTMSVVDIKTSYANSFDIRQLQVYAYFLKNANPPTDINLIFYNTRSRKWLHEQPFTDDDHNRTGHFINQTIDEIESKEASELRPCLSEHCSICEYRFVCEAISKENKIFFEPTTEGTLQEYFYLKSKLDVETKVLKERSKHMLLTYREGYVGYKDNPSFLFDSTPENLAVFIETCIDKGIDPYKYMSINNSKTKSKRFGNDEFNELKKIKHLEKFGFHKS